MTEQSLRIVAIGDSLIYGRHDPGGGWVARLRTVIERDDKWAAAFNLGIGGETTRSLSPRFVRELRVRDPNLVVIGVGTNDARRHNGRPGIQLPEYERRLRSLVHAAHGMGATVALATVHPYCEALEEPGEYSHRNDDLSRYLDVQRRIGVKQGCIMLDFWAAVSEAPPSIYADVVHLNPDGHELLATVAAAVLQRHGYLRG